MVGVAVPAEAKQSPAPTGKGLNGWKYCCKQHLLSALAKNLRKSLSLVYFNRYSQLVAEKKGVRLMWVRPNKIALALTGIYIY
jgi:hypothetical protein